MSPHNPRQIQPLGNLLLSSDPTALAYRQLSLGHLACVPDEVLFKIFTELAPSELHRAQAVSRYFFAWCAALDGLWKAALLSRSPNLVGWAGTWRSTFLGRAELETDPISLKTVYSDVLFQPSLAAGFSVDHAVGVNRRTFRPTIERPEGPNQALANRPLILSGLMQDWKALHWTLENLAERFPHLQFRAEASLVTLADYKIYHDQCETEESPLYLFDPQFVEKTAEAEETGGLSAEYSVPSLFESDLFGCLGPKRPDFRWLIIGPARSGSTWHKDPNGTSAWNAVISGRKLWICFPPEITPPGVWVNEDESEVDSPLSIAEWFLNYYQVAKEEYGSKAKDPLKRGQMLQGICETGEIFYVPSGWWHLVVNLESSIAITQNFVSESELTDVLNFMKYRPDQLSGFKFTDQINNKQDILPEFLKALKSSTTNQISSSKLDDCIEQMEKTRKEQVSSLFQKIKKRRKPINGTSKESMWEKLVKRTKLEEQQVDQLDNVVSLNSSEAFSFGFVIEDDSSGPY